MPSKPLPSGWTEMTFGEMASQISERVDDPQKAGVDIYVGLEHLDPGDLRIRRRGTPGDVEATKLRVRPGQIIFGKRRAYQRKVAVADFDGIVSAHAMILQEKPSLVPGFLPFFMQSDVFMDRAVTISEGGLSPTIKWKTLAAEKFLIPPPQQQRELVELMRGFGAAVEAGEEAAAAYSCLDEQLLKSLMDNAYGWTTQRLTDVAEVRLGRQRSPDNVRGVRPMEYLRAANVRDGFIDYSDVLEMDFTVEEQKIYQLRKDDILLVEGGEARDVGMCAMFTGDTEVFCMQKTLLRVRAKEDYEVSPIFLFKLLQNLKRSGAFARLASGTKLKHLTLVKLAALEITLPPLNKQLEILKKLEVSDSGRVDAKQHVVRLQNLRSSILNTALTPSVTVEEPALVEVLA